MITNIKDVMRYLVDQVQALQSQADELLLENNLIRARNDRLESDLARPESIEVGLMRAELANFRDLEAAVKLALDALTYTVGFMPDGAAMNRVLEAQEALKKAGVK